MFPAPHYGPGSKIGLRLLSNHLHRYCQLGKTDSLFHGLQDHYLIDHCHSRRRVMNIVLILEYRCCYARFWGLVSLMSCHNRLSLKGARFFQQDETWIPLPKAGGNLNMLVTVNLNCKSDRSYLHPLRWQ